MQWSSFLRMVQRNGQPLTITKYASGTYDPSTGSNTRTAVTQSFTGYFYNDNNGLFTDFDVVRGTRALLVPFKNISVVPEVGDDVVGDRDTVRITSVSHIMQNENPVCYVLGTGE